MRGRSPTRGGRADRPLLELLPMRGRRRASLSGHLPPPGDGKTMVPLRCGPAQVGAFQDLAVPLRRDGCAGPRSCGRAMTRSTRWTPRRTPATPSRWIHSIRTSRPSPRTAPSRRPSRGEKANESPRYGVGRARQCVGRRHQVSLCEGASRLSARDRRRPNALKWRHFDQRPAGLIGSRGQRLRNDLRRRCSRKATAPGRAGRKLVTRSPCDGSLRYPCKLACSVTRG